MKGQVKNCFGLLRECGGGGGHTLGITQPKQSRCPREFDRRFWHRGGTLDVSARKLKKLCLRMGRELNCLIPLGISATLISAQVSCIKMRHTLDSPHLICQWPYNLAKLDYKPGTSPAPLILSYPSRTNPCGPV